MFFDLQIPITTFDIFIRCVNLIMSIIIHCCTKTNVLSLMCSNHYICTKLLGINHHLDKIRNEWCVILGCANYIALKIVIHLGIESRLACRKAFLLDLDIPG
jgi:hypothetical protein